MARETNRKDYGETPKGFVAVIAFEGTADENDHVAHRFEVRHGVRTVGTYETAEQADAVASALVGAPPEPAAATAGPEPAYVAPTRARVSRPR